MSRSKACTIAGYTRLDEQHQGRMKPTSTGTSHPKEHEWTVDTIQEILKYIDPRDGAHSVLPVDYQYLQSSKTTFGGINVRDQRACKDLAVDEWMDHFFSHR